MQWQWVQFGDTIINMDHVTRIHLREGHPDSDPDSMVLEVRSTSLGVTILTGDDARRIWTWMEMGCGTRDAPPTNDLGDYINKPEPLSRGLSRANATPGDQSPTSFGGGVGES